MFPFDKLIEVNDYQLNIFFNFFLNDLNIYPQLILLLEQENISLLEDFNNMWIIKNYV